MSNPGLIARVPLFLMAVIIAGVTLIALLFYAAATYHDLGYWRLTFFAPSVVLAAYYLSEYRKLPYEPWHFAPPRAPPSAVAVAPVPPVANAAADEEPFEDPVEEADRLEQEKAGETPDASSSVPGQTESGRP